MAEECVDMHNLRGEAVFGKRVFDSCHAERVAMVQLHRSNDMVIDLGHVEEAEAKPVARESANLVDGCFQALQRQMFEQIMDEAEVEVFSRPRDLKNICRFKTNMRKQKAGV